MEKKSIKTEAPQDELGLADSKANLEPVIVEVLIKLPQPMWAALCETQERLQASGQVYSVDMLIAQSIGTELRRRNVTWWEARASKAMRIMGGVLPD